MDINYIILSNPLPFEESSYSAQTPYKMGSGGVNRLGKITRRNAYGRGLHRKAFLPIKKYSRRRRQKLCAAM